MKKLSIFFLVTFLGSCASVTSLQKKGSVVPKSFRHSITFKTYKSVIFFPVEVNGISKNFLFDTGAQLSLIQDEKASGKKITAVGTTQQKVILTKETTESLKIGEVDFVQSTSMLGDFQGLKEQIPNFGGIIGQSVINKASWKIDYPNKSLELSNEDLSDESFTTLKIVRKNGSPYALITIEGQTYTCLIDSGASTPGISIPLDHPLGKKLLDKYSFKDTTRETYALGGSQKFEVKKGTDPSVQLGGIA